MKQPTIHQELKMYPERESKDFAFYSANLGYFIPSLPVCEHEKLFKESCAHQYRSVLEQSEDHLLSTIKLIDSGELTFEKPSIIVTFHTASYRLLSPCLANEGVGHALVVTKDVLQQQGEAFVDIIKHIAPSLYFELIDAEEPQAVLKMRQVLRKGHHLLVYADGNSGVGQHTKDSRHSICLDFLSGKLWVRAGIAYLSFLMKCPIIPIVSSFISMKRELRVKPAIVPLDGDTREGYIKRTMINLFSCLERALERDVTQWENWFFVHQDMEMPDEEVNDGLVFRQFNPVIWAPYRVMNSFFVLHKPTYQSYRLTAEQFDWMRNSRFN